MAIMFHTNFGDPVAWLAELRRRLPDDDLRTWPDLGDRTDIEFAVFWDIPLTEFATMPNLRALMLLGSGTSHLVPLDALPDVPIVRLVDDSVAHDMAAYALHWIIHFHRNMHVFAAQQRRSDWQPQPFRATAEHTVGVLGFGNIGRHVADAAQAMGYPVRGWSKTPKPPTAVETFVGPAELAGFLSGTHTLVNVLPLTEQTRGLLDSERFATLPKGASVINIGRGGTIDDDALLSALDRGHLSGAALDALREEPLPAASPLWTHPKISITPHVSGAAQPRSSASYIAANIERIRRGEDPFPIFDPARGY